MRGGLWDSWRGKKGRERKRKGGREKKINREESVISSKCETVFTSVVCDIERHTFSGSLMRVAKSRSSTPDLCLIPVILHRVCPGCALGVHSADGMEQAWLMAAVRMGRDGSLQRRWVHRLGFPGVRVEPRGSAWVLCTF